MIGHGGTPWEMDWCSVYSARALTLPDYVHGRVLFTGDAAHMLPIFGVRGANTGWQDAQAWPGAWPGVPGRGPRVAAASYSSERVGRGARDHRRSGQEHPLHDAADARFSAAARRGAVALAEPAFVGPLYHWRTSRPHEYTHSPLNSAGDDNRLFKAGPATARRRRTCAWAPTTTCWTTWAAASTCCTSRKALRFPRRCRRSWPPGQGRAAARGGRGRGQPVAGADLTLADADGHFRQRYGVLAGGAAYLLRPDQHVCARWMSLDAGRLQSALATAMNAPVDVSFFARAAKPITSYRPYWAKRFGTAPFLPMSRAEMEQLGWDSCDVILVTGDAYVDHPSFGMAVIGRVLEAQGFRVGIIAQPDWQSAEPSRRWASPTCSGA
jgi:3-(3-hydroxy-phenyl)propionate hydroxylase